MSGILASAFDPCLDFDEVGFNLALLLLDLLVPTTTFFTTFFCLLIPRRMIFSTNVRISLRYELCKIVEPILFVTAIHVEKVHTTTDRHSNIATPSTPGTLNNHSTNMLVPSK